MCGRFTAFQAVGVGLVLFSEFPFIYSQCQIRLICTVEKNHQEDKQEKELCFCLFVNSRLKSDHFCKIQDF